MSRKWIYNQNSYKHRGVWHIIEGHYRFVDIEEKVYESRLKIYKDHSKNCGGVVVYSEPKDYWTRGYPIRVDGCTCDIKTSDMSAETGSYLYRHVTPAHRKIKSQPILCHQTQVRASPVVRSSSSYSRKHNDGDIVEIVDRVVPLHIWEGDLPPGPTCSRCLNKAEKMDAE